MSSETKMSFWKHYMNCEPILPGICIALRRCPFEALTALSWYCVHREARRPALTLRCARACRQAAGFAITALSSRIPWCCQPRFKPGTKNPMLTEAGIELTLT